MHTAEELKKLAKQTSNGKLKTCYLALYQFKQGTTRTQIAINLGVSRGTVNTWVSKYLKDSLEGLKDKPKSGRPCRLSQEQQIQLKQFIQDGAVKPDGGRLIASDVRTFICDTFHVEYKLRNIYRLLHTLGFSWITSRSKHPKQSQAAQDAFKKTSGKKRASTSQKIYRLNK